MSKAKQYLKQYFGYDSFRGVQEQIVEHILSGRDCLVLMPTGGGKSICYQVPALINEGTALVVSPLISLMKDQVDALRANNIAAAYLNSSLSYAEEQELVAKCRQGKIKLLYVSPEKVLSLADGFLNELKVSLIAIDEAHCVSQWGHDFRPEYKELHKLRQKFTGVPVAALTATADKITRNDILTLLGLQDPELFISSFDRPNLSLTVKPGLNKKEKLRDIKTYISNNPAESGIIYCTSRSSTEMLSGELRKAGISSRAYHAGMSSLERSEVQEKFINDDLQVVCATIAFGMGIDKSNVRFVMHYNLPRSVESYYQEIGRGGRDGLPASTILYYSLGDLIMLRNFAQSSGQPEISLEKLSRMQEFAEARHCRRKILLSYFGQQHTENCGNCDVCKHPPEMFDGTVLAQKALSALARIQNMSEQVGVYMLTDVLRGMKHKEILERKLDQIKTYGAGADLSSRTWNQYLLQMIQLGVFEIAYNEGNTLQITGLGELILKGKYSLHLHTYTDNKLQKSNPVSAQVTTMAGQPEIFEKLRMLRKQIADELHFPPYVIFHDSTLKDMAAKIPQTEEEMLAVSGVSVSKMEKYGYRFLEITSQYEQSGASTSDVKEVLEETNLIKYMEELRSKNLRFSSAVVGKILIGSAGKSYSDIAAEVSFNRLLAGRLTYKQVSERIKPFYEPFEQAEKELRQQQRMQESEQDERLMAARAYFEGPVFNNLSNEEIERIRKAIGEIALQRSDDSVSPAVRELRKTFPRSHEPWSGLEESLFGDVVKKCNDMILIVAIFGRSENSVLAMSTRFLSQS